MTRFHLSAALSTGALTVMFLGCTNFEFDNGQRIGNKHILSGAPPVAQGAARFSSQDENLEDFEELLNSRLSFIADIADDGFGLTVAHTDGVITWLEPEGRQTTVLESGFLTEPLGTPLSLSDLRSDIRKMCRGTAPGSGTEADPADVNAFNLRNKPIDLCDTFTGKLAIAIDSLRSRAKDVRIYFSEDAAVTWDQEECIDREIANFGEVADASCEDDSDCGDTCYVDRNGHEECDSLCLPLVDASGGRTCNTLGCQKRCNFDFNYSCGPHCVDCIDGLCHTMTLEDCPKGLVMNVRSGLRVFVEPKDDTLIDLDFWRMFVDLKLKPISCGGDCCGVGCNASCKVRPGNLFDPSGIPGPDSFVAPELDVAASAESEFQQTSCSIFTACWLIPGLPDVCRGLCTAAREGAAEASGHLAEGLGELADSLLNFGTLRLRFRDLLPPLPADPPPPSRTDRIDSIFCLSPCPSSNASTCMAIQQLCTNFRRLDLFDGMLPREVPLNRVLVSTGDPSDTVPLGGRRNAFTESTFQLLASGFQVDTVNVDFQWLIDLDEKFETRCVGSDPPAGCMFLSSVCGRDGQPISFANANLCEKLLRPGFVMPLSVDAFVAGEAEHMSVPAVPALARFLQASPAVATEVRRLFTEALPGGAELGEMYHCSGPLDEPRCEPGESGAIFNLRWDRDNDCVPDVSPAEDNCLGTSNADQADADNDGVGDACDFCPNAVDVDGDNAGDFDDDGVGDPCDCDADGDGCRKFARRVGSSVEICPGVTPPFDSDDGSTSVDTDGDGRANDCDLDNDGDGVLDTDDNCEFVSNASQADLNSDGQGDICDFGCRTATTCFENGLPETIVTGDFRIRSGPVPFVCVNPHQPCTRWTGIDFCETCTLSAGLSRVALGSLVNPGPIWFRTAADFGLTSPFEAVAGLPDRTLDGLDETVLGIPRTQVCQGTLCTPLAGTAIGLDSQTGTELWRVSSVQASAEFATQVATFGDLMVVTAPGALDMRGEQTGAVYVYDTAGPEPVLTARFDGPVPGERFGQSLSIISGSGQAAALLIGAPEADPNFVSGAGRIYLTGLDGTVFQTFDGFVSGGKLGTSVAFVLGDLQAEEPPTVAGGMPDALGGKGGVVTFLLDGNVRSFLQGTEANGRLGTKLVAADFDASGRTHLAVSEPGGSAGEGRVLLVNSTLKEVQRFEAPFTGPHGFALTVAGDASGDGSPDLSIGFPREGSDFEAFLVWNSTEEIPDPLCESQPGGCPSDACSTSSDRDADGRDDCAEANDGDAWTSSTIFNGMRVSVAQHCHSSPTCSLIDTLDEVNACVAAHPAVEERNQYAGWDWTNPPDAVNSAGYGFQPNWTTSMKDWQANWQGFIQLATTGYHCFAIRGSNSNGCASLFFHDEDASPAQTGGTTRCYWRGPGTYPIRWFYETKQFSSSDMHVQYCAGGTSPCEPSQVLPAAKLRPDVQAQACIPRTCEAAEADCGEIDDGCGDIVDCDEQAGGCAAPLTCGGGGRANVCGCEGVGCFDPNADADGDGFSDAEEATNPTSFVNGLFNGALVGLSSPCHSFPSCSAIDSLAEVKACENPSATVLRQYSGWNFATLASNVTDASYGFQPAWTQALSQFQVDARALIGIESAGKHCFKITGSTSSQCGALYFDKATSGVVTNGSTQCYDVQPGMYELRWLYETKTSGQRSMQINYCYGGATTCTPTAILPASLLTPPDVDLFGAPPANCRSGVREGHGYLFCDDAQSWSSAEAFCEAQGNATLARIDSASENAFVASRMSGDSWVGGSLGASDTWRWERNDSAFWIGYEFGSPVGGLYSNWGFDEPDLFDECVELEQSGYWEGTTCSHSKKFVCELELDVCQGGEKLFPGECGCDVPDTDTDFDGLADCVDQCPSDALKGEPGICGCGVSELDSDFDGTVDCVDLCPADSAKVAAGQCGCGVTEDLANSDGDGAINCLDACPLDSTKVAYGTCGCGNPDVDTDGDDLLDCQDPCPLDDSDPAGCLAYAPSNVDPAVVDFTGASDAVIDCGTTTIDTSGSVTFTNWCSGSAPPFVLQTQASGPDIVVVLLHSLLVEQGATLRLVGNRPVAFVVASDVQVDGVVDASGNGTVAGAGGGAVCGSSAGAAGSGSSSLGGGGGGGGGFGTLGGAGGYGDVSGNAGAGGAKRAGTGLVPLVAGCGGGYGGGCSSASGGGGAVQVSAYGAVFINGTIDASGAYGANGCGSEGGGGGGASGGGILIETLRSFDLELDGELLVDGGNGGNGASGGASGVGSTSGSAPGSAGQSHPTNGGGGGGGGYGRTVTRTRTGL